MYNVIPVKFNEPWVKAIIGRTFPGYRGRKVKLVQEDKITFSDTNWGGGTRSQYVCIGLDSQTRSLFPGGTPAPWVNPVEGKTAILPPGAIVVEHTIFCGKDVGIRIHVNPNTTGLYPPGLTSAE